jgi:hypothetical protein
MLNLGCRSLFNMGATSMWHLEVNRKNRGMIKDIVNHYDQNSIYRLIEVELVRKFRVGPTHGTHSSRRSIKGYLQVLSAWL